MLKRKRPGKESVEEKFLTLRQELYKALRMVKGFERQRQAKRLRESKGITEKTRRLENEIAVLKSLDLQQAAHAHLCASLLKIKAVAESPGLPEEIKAGVPKPNVSEEEKAVLHNVTSALYNKPPVRAVADEAVRSICEALSVPAPGKKGKGKKEVSIGRRGKEDQPADRGTCRTSKSATPDDQIKPAKPDEHSADDGEVEAVSRLEGFLGGSSDDDRPGSESGEELDPMAITSDEDDEENEADPEDSELDIGDSADDSGDGSNGEEWEGFEETEDGGSEEDSSVEGLTPPPKRVAKAGTAPARTRATDSTFLPTLMGGYISGSESASDVDIAPPRKNRRGQRARQAIWEKRYKDKAKHLKKDSKDQGWDLRRGAVDDRGAKPWKRGIKNPFERKGAEGANLENTEQSVPRRKPKTEPQNTGPLHPSWEARKKAKEKQESAKFQGKKITFD